MEHDNDKYVKPWVAFVSSDIEKRQSVKDILSKNHIDIMTTSEFSSETLPCAFKPANESPASSMMVILDLQDCSRDENRRICEEMQGVSGKCCEKFVSLRELSYNENVVFVGALNGPLERYVSPCEKSGFEAIVELPLNTLEVKRIKQLIDVMHYRSAHKRERDERQRIFRAHEKLQAVSKSESAIDHLTELCSPRSILNKINVEEARFQRNRRSFCLLMGDIDQLNAQVTACSSRLNVHEDQISEKMLKQVAELLRDGLRAGDSLSRWEEDTYLMLLPDTDLQGGQLLASRMQDLLKRTKLTVNGMSEIELAMTFSLIEYDGRNGINQSIDILQQLLSKGKEEGGNCINSFID